MRSRASAAGAKARATRCGESRQGGQDGFAILAALLIIALATLAATTLVALVIAGRAISHADARGDQTLALAERGVAEALESLRWRPSLVPSVGSSVVLPATRASADDSCETILEGVAAPASPLPGPDGTAAVPSDRRCVAVTVTAHDGRAVRRLRVLALVGPPALPAGLTVSGDADLRAPVTIEGSGLYAGGAVRGRQFVTFTGAPGDPSPAPDHAHADLYAEAGVHADVGIFDAGGEEHLEGSAPPADTDTHDGGAPSAEVLTLPGPAALGDLADHAVPLAAALDAGVLYLAALPDDPPVTDVAGGAEASDPIGLGPEGGIIAVTDAAAMPADLSVCGHRGPPPQSCPATVVIDGDAIVGPSPTSSGDGVGEAGASLTGALIVCGSLFVRAPLVIDGSLAAARLVVEAPITVVFPADDRAPPGPATVEVLQWSDTTGR